MSIRNKDLTIFALFVAITEIEGLVPKSLKPQRSNITSGDNRANYRNGCAKCGFDEKHTEDEGNCDHKDTNGWTSCRY